MYKITIGVLLSLGLTFGTYLIFLKSAAPKGGTAQAAVSSTTVEMQLVQIAQAERIHFAQTNSYATMEELASSGEFKMKNPDPSGYAYSVKTSPTGFVATASHPAPPEKAKDYPTLTIDESMQVHHPDDAAAPAQASDTVPEFKPQPDLDAAAPSAPGAAPQAATGTPAAPATSPAPATASAP